MLLFLYILMNAAVLFVFMKTRRTMHMLEIFVCWWMASYVYQNYSALCFMNFKTLIIPDMFTPKAAHFLNRIVLYPVLMVVFLQLLLRMSTFLRKFALYIGFILLLSALDGLDHVSGILIHADWRAWWTIALWVITLPFLIVCMKLFRIILFKGDHTA
ncbi:hypothetical protein A8990_106151 [Paenibacillus taihuensis]|uniref:Uncharacterized protein n=1 Tax=Paenibacillus taihuensis TaxID=1156355 RepID=A0A3D9SBI5_9BACL|nr:hypothetical protein [Paenibacillus taihuensis]REE90646.1 hypothetical protein A8990_106151 [Paenibacillus taihuensis]